MTLMFFYAILCGGLVVTIDDMGRVWKSIAVVSIIFLVYFGTVLREHELATDEEKKPYKVLINNEMKIIKDTLLITKDSIIINHNDELEIFTKSNEKF